MRWVRRLELAALLLLVAGAPLAFGTVHPLARAALLAWVGLVLALRAVELVLGGRAAPASGAGPLLIIGSALVLWSFLACLPLPGGVVRFLSPPIHDARQATRLLLDDPPAYRLAIAAHRTWEASLLHLAALSLFWFLVTWKPRRREVLLLLLTVFLVATAVAGYGIWQAENDDPRIWGLSKRFYREEATGTYINKNHFAGLLELAFPLGLAFVFAPAGALWLLRLRAEPPPTYPAGPRERSAEDLPGFTVQAGANLRRALALACCAGLLFALVLSRSRMGVLALSTGLLGMVALGLGSGRRGLYLGLLLACLAVPVSLMIWTGFAPLAKLAGAMEGETKDADARLAIWRASLALVRERPGSGAGAGSFAAAFGSVHPEGLANKAFQAENDYLQLAVELGLVGLVLAVAGAALWVRRMVAIVSAHPGVARVLGIGILGSVLAILVHGLADNNLLMVPANRFLALALAATGLLLPRLARPAGAETDPLRESDEDWTAVFPGLRGSGATGEPPSPSWRARATLALLATLLLWEGARLGWAALRAPYQLDESSVLADSRRFWESLLALSPEARRARLRSAAEGAERALAVDPRHDGWIHERATLLGALARSGASRDEARRLREAEERGYRQAVALSPYEGRYRLSLGLRLLWQGKALQADRQMQQAVRLGRGAPDLQIRAAEYFLHRHAVTKEPGARDLALAALRRSCAAGLPEEVRRAGALLWRALPDPAALAQILPLADPVVREWAVAFLRDKGRPKEALDLLRGGADWSSDPARLCLAGEIQWTLRDRAGAYEQWRLALHLAHGPQIADRISAFLTREPAAWEGLLRHLAAAPSPLPEVLFRLALVAAARDKAEALRLVERAIRQRPTEVRYYELRDKLMRR